MMRTHDVEDENPSCEDENQKITTEEVVQGSFPFTISTFSSKRVHDDIITCTYTTLEAIDFFITDALQRDSEVRSD
jgi:hypothetical protein